MGVTSTTSPLAIDGGAPVRVEPWPHWPQVDEKTWSEIIEPRLRRVYLSGTEGLPGPVARRFAGEWAERMGCSYGAMTTHGTDAVMASIAGVLDLDGIGSGGEIIVPNYTFVASASAALAMRCRINFVDIEPRRFTLDPRAVEAAIGSDTVAVMPVHLGGQAANMTALKAVCAKYGLALIEDCAQAHGAAWAGRPVGSVGDAGAFSFQSSKNLTAGEGGCVVTNDFDVYERVASFMDVGRRPGGQRWEYPRIGWNYRPSEYLAALLEARAAAFDDELAARKANAAELTRLLDNIDGIATPEIAPGCTSHGWHLYMLLYNPDGFGGHSRAEFVAALCSEGIPAWAGYEKPLSEQDAFVSLHERYPEIIRWQECPHTSYSCEYSVWLPGQLLLADKSDVTQIAEAVRKIQVAWAG